MRNRSLAKVAAVSVAGALALAACSNSTPNNSGGLNSGGTGSGTQGAIKIGFQGPLSGENAQLGINEINATKLALDQWNKANADLQVQLVELDDVGDPAKAPAAAAKAIQDKEIVAVVGPSFSGATKAVCKTYEEAGLVLVSPSATNPDLTKTLNCAAFHRVVPPDSLEGDLAGQWLAKKAKTVYLVDDLTDYGKGAVDAVEAAVKAGGATVVKREGVDKDKTKDYSVIAQAVKASGAEAVFYGGYDAQAALFAKALTAVNYPGLRMSGNGVLSTVFSTNSGADGDGWYISCGCLDATKADNAKEFTAAYKAMFNTDPSTYSPESYDVTNAVLEAIKAAKAKGTVDRKSVWDAVKALNYKGLTTTIKFAANGDVENQVINLYKQDGGKIGLVGDIKTS